MRPLPRLLAFTDDRVADRDDLGVRAAAIAAAGPAIGLVARLPDGSTDRLAALAQRFVALAAPPMASVFVTGRADVARAVRGQGVILRINDLPVPEARTVLGNPSTTVFRSVHTVAEAETAAAEGADALIVGSIWPSPTHPDRPAGGTGLLRAVAALGLPAFAIGGVTPARAAEAAAAGAWGVAAITAVWDAAEPYETAIELVKPWMPCD